MVVQSWGGSENKSPDWKLPDEAFCNSGHVADPPPSASRQRASGQASARACVYVWMDAWMDGWREGGRERATSRPQPFSGSRCRARLAGIAPLAPEVSAARLRTETGSEWEATSAQRKVKRAAPWEARSPCSPQRRSRCGTPSGREGRRAGTGRTVRAP